MKFYLVLLVATLFACAPKSGDADRTGQNPAEVPEVTVRQFEKLRLSGSAVVIDVRTPEEIEEGKVPDALEIDYESNDFERKIAGLDREKSYMLYCASGARSLEAAELMLQKGFQNVYNLKGGYEAWEREVSVQ